MAYLAQSVKDLVEVYQNLALADFGTGIKVISVDGTTCERGLTYYTNSHKRDTASGFPDPGNTTRWVGLYCPGREQSLDLERWP